MIIKSSTNPYSQSTRRKIDQLYTCLRYCEDEFQCRRTIQLEFFGEKFDRSKCRKTCDNCRAAREIDKRNMTHVAQAILQLLASIQLQRGQNGFGVTLLQLTELYRGSKAKAATKFLNVKRLQGYGDAAKHNLKKKADIDRVAHAMIFERILREESEQNKQGFSTDYVHPGDLAAEIQRNGGRQFFVNFPKIQSQGKENVTDNKTGTIKKKAAAKRSSTGQIKKKSKSSSTAGPNLKEIAASYENEDNDDDDSLLADPEDPSAQEALPESFLSPGLVLKLYQRIRKATGIWAAEEQMNGNAIYYWNIMSNSVMKQCAAQFPTTVEELQALGVLGENVIKEYGGRLLKCIRAFIQQEGLDSLVKQKQQMRPTKKQKTVIVLDDDDEEEDKQAGENNKKPAAVASVAAPVALDEDDDEFGGNDIDFNAIPDPCPENALSRDQKKSPYFNT